MQILGSSFRNVLRFAQIATAVLVLAGCASDDAAKPKQANVGARLQPIGGSAGAGLVTFKPYDGGLTLVADVGGFSGGQYRFVIHTTPVCTSPNGFAAGPPFLLPGTDAPIVVPVFVTIDKGTATLTQRVPGIAFTGPNGIEGKSLVLHAGEIGPLDAQPGVPNNRVACGIIGPVPTLF
jgi:Cu-Zn family superoxide dismutase